MPLSISQSWGTLPNPFNYAELVAFVQSVAVNFDGTVDTDDVEDGAITSAKTKAGPHFYAAATRSIVDLFEVYTVALDPEVTELVEGLWFWCQPNADCTLPNLPSVKIKVNNTTATTVLKGQGESLQARDIKAYQPMLVIYDGSNFRVVSDTRTPRLYGTLAGSAAGGTADAVTLTFTKDFTLPTITGYEIEFTASGTNTGPVTLTLTCGGSVLAATAITKAGTTALSAGDIVAGQVVRVVYDGTRFQLLTPVAQSGIVAITGDARGLVVRNTSTSSVTIAATEVVVKDGANSAKLLRNVSTSLTINGAGVGVGELDTGSEAASTFYYIWLIHNPTTGVTGAVYSTSATAPSQANTSGFTYNTLLSVVYNDSGSNLIDFIQFDREVSTTWRQALNAGSVTTSGTSLDLADYVPPIATFVRGFAGTSSSTPCKLSIWSNGVSAEELGLVEIMADTTGTASTWGAIFAGGPFRIPMLHTSSRQIALQAATTTNYHVFVTGFTI